MRTVGSNSAVRLYHLDDDGGGASTLVYGTMAEALALAASQSEQVQAGLYLQTRDDVVPYLDFIEG